MLSPVIYIGQWLVYTGMCEHERTWWWTGVCVRSTPEHASECVRRQVNVALVYGQWQRAMESCDAYGRLATRGTREDSEEGVNVRVKPTTANRRVMKTPVERRPGRRALEESNTRDADDSSANVRANACLPVRIFECEWREWRQGSAAWRSDHDLH